MRWLVTNGLRFFLQFWYGKVPMFWLPSGWVPWYVEWLLSFPKAPLGSISIQVWFVACASAVQIASQALAAVWALRIQSRIEEKGKPMKMGAGGGVKGDGGEKKEEKKEL